MSLWISATPCLAKVTRENGKIVMEESDYRFFITRIQTLEAKSESLEKVLAEERASFDVYIDNVIKEREARKARDEKVRRSKLMPGIIVGGGFGSDSGKPQGVVGLGWKLLIGW